MRQPSAASPRPAASPQNLPPTAHRHEAPPVATAAARSSECCSHGSRATTAASTAASTKASLQRAVIPLLRCDCLGLCRQQQQWQRQLATVRCKQACIADGGHS